MIHEPRKLRQTMKGPIFIMANRNIAEKFDCYSIHESLKYYLIFIKLYSIILFHWSIAPIGPIPAADLDGSVDSEKDMSNTQSRKC